MSFEVETSTWTPNIVQQTASDMTKYLKRMKVSISQVTIGSILIICMAKWLKRDNKVAVGFLSD